MTKADIFPRRKSSVSRPCVPDHLVSSLHLIRFMPLCCTELLSDRWFPQRGAIVVSGYRENLFLKLSVNWRNDIKFINRNPTTTPFLPAASRGCTSSKIHLQEYGLPSHQYMAFRQASENCWLCAVTTELNFMTLNKTWLVISVPVQGSQKVCVMNNLIAESYITPKTMSLWHE